jgi:hypothetical protein
VAFERFRKAPWPVVKTRIEARHAEYGGTLGVDSTGVGDAVIGFFETCAPEPIVFSAKSKTQMVDAAVVLLERGGLKGPPSGNGIEDLWQELGDYRWEDDDLVQDCVMALAMVARAMETGRLVGHVL